MSNLLTEYGSIFTQMIQWAGNVASTIVTTPIFLVGAGVVITGAAVNLFKKLVH